MQAQVVVDVPTMQTNQPYTYQIPTHLEEMVEAGMRVIVPFGKGNRRVQGFVVETSLSETDTTNKIKEIDEVLDLAPVLNQEMLELGAWIAQETFAFQINVFQSMLPNVMRAKYSKTLQLIDGVDLHDYPEIADLFVDRYEIPFNAEEVDPAWWPQLQRLQKKQMIQFGYYVDDRAQAKMVTALRPTKDAAFYENELTQLRKNAVKQARLLRYLAQAESVYQPQREIVAALELDYASLQKAEDNGWIERTEIEQYRLPKLTSAIERTEPLVLNSEQEIAYAAITDSLVNEPQTFLLEGVTGSGKTEVYLQSIAQTLAQGKTALMLVPEITLTPQMVRRVKGRFGDAVAVMHSGLSDGERFDEWRRIERQEVNVVVGARSAVFAPLANIGLIIMDEEHESTYKQDENPRYHARDVALWRAKYHGAVSVLGSATPSLESRARAQKGVYGLLTMTKRALNNPLPETTIVDMREAVKVTGDDLFSPELMTAIQTRLDRKEQSVLMLNRRGFANFVTCRDCGETPTCVNCDLALTMHAHQGQLVCHYCGYSQAIPTACPACGSNRIRPFGTGTEKVEQELQARFPEARILRMDADTTRRKGASDALLETFGAGKADILLGTQMIAKGLDFPNVTLVGVLNADTTLGLPDFRAAERTFQLLTQVSGRAGRADKLGEVVIQTFNPDHYAIQFAQAHDYEGFYGQEMSLRREWRYAPYFYTIQIKIGHQDEAHAAKVAYQLAEWLKPQMGSQTIMLGPSTGAVARLKNKYYYRLVLKYRNGTELFNALTELMQKGQVLQREKVTLVIDREPVSFI